MGISMFNYGATDSVRHHSKKVNLNFFAKDNQDCRQRVMTAIEFCKELYRAFIGSMVSVI